MLYLCRHLHAFSSFCGERVQLEFYVHILISEPRGKNEIFYIFHRRCHETPSLGTVMHCDWHADMPAEFPLPGPPSTAQSLSFWVQFATPKDLAFKKKNYTLFEISNSLRAEQDRNRTTLEQVQWVLGKVI